MSSQRHLLSIEKSERDKTAKMVLSNANKQLIKKVGQEISPLAEVLGADALARLFLLHPQTKTYFPKFTCYSASDAKVKQHGRKVMAAVVNAALNLDNLSDTLSNLAREHGTDLLVDPHNFHLFANCIAVTLAVHLPSFNSQTHHAVDKFLELVTHELTSNYR